MKKFLVFKKDSDYQVICDKDMDTAAPKYPYYATVDARHICDVVDSIVKKDADAKVYNIFCRDITQQQSDYPFKVFTSLMD